MTLLQTARAASDCPEFKLRVQAAVFGLAQDVLNEDPDTDGHPLRAGLAIAVVSDPASVVRQFIWLCAANPSIASTVVELTGGKVAVNAPDSDILYVCSSYWSTVAGWRGEGTSL